MKLSPSYTDARLVSVTECEMTQPNCISPARGPQETARLIGMYTFLCIYFPLAASSVLSLVEIAGTISSDVS